VKVYRENLRLFQCSPATARKKALAPLSEKKFVFNFIEKYFKKGDFS